MASPDDPNSTNSRAPQTDTIRQQTSSATDAVNATDQGEVAGQISDAVSQVNVSAIGVGPAYAALQSMLGQSQAQSVMMANMVSSQRQLSISGLTTLTKSVDQLFSRRS